MSLLLGDEAENAKTDGDGKLRVTLSPIAGKLHLQAVNDASLVSNNTG